MVAGLLALYRTYPSWQCCKPIKTWVGGAFVATGPTAARPADGHSRSGGHRAGAAPAAQRL
jgi:hypothetical protein